jgi:hypothetical protein
LSHKSPPVPFSKQVSQYPPPINQSFQPQSLSHYGPQHPPPHAAPRQQQKKQQVPSHYQPQPQQIHQIPDNRYPAPAGSNFQQHVRQNPNVPISINLNSKPNHEYNQSSYPQSNPQQTAPQNEQPDQKAILLAKLASMLKNAKK